MQKTNIFLAISITTLLSGCGGGSSTDEITTPTVEYSLPSSIQIVQSEDTTTAVASNISSLSVVDYPSTSDYKKDQTDFWFKTEGDEALSEVNSILYYIGQMNWEDNIDKGPYIALVADKEEKINKNNSQDSSQENDSEDLMKFIMNVTTGDNGKPIVDVWLTENTPVGNLLISVRALLEEGESDDFPYGKFKTYINGENLVFIKKSCDWNSLNIEFY